MTVEELEQVAFEYPGDQFVHVRVWVGGHHHFDVAVDKIQQGVDGAMLVTCTIPETSCVAD